MRRLFAAVFLITALPVAAADRAADRWVERTLRSMSLDEKIGQMIIPPTPGVFRSEDSEEFQKVKRDITQFHVGGYHTYGGDPAGLALLIHSMQRISKHPLLITADLEGGAGFVFPGATRMPLAMAIGATGDTQMAFEAGRVTALEGRALGVHVNFYPVVDVQNNARNPIINIRSFGENPESVSAMARAYIRGAQENGQIATAKHFPGHGDVATDSHMELPVLEVDRKRLDAIELPSFRAAIAENVGAVMSAHIALPAIESEKGLPATLSKAILTGILREELQFKGLIFTDAMTMRGVSAHYKDDDATLRAVNAGADIILFPVSVENSFKAMKSAVESGALPLSRIEQSVRRILQAKATLGLHLDRTADLAKVTQIAGRKEHREAAQRMMDRAVTLVRDEKNVLPLRASPELRVLHLNIVDNRNGWRQAAGNAFGPELVKRFPRAVSVTIDDRTTGSELDMVRKLAELSDAVLVNGYIRVAAYKGSIDLSTEQLNLLKQLSKMKKPFVFSLFGSPYLLTQVPELPSYILAYDTHTAAELAVLKAITGEIEFQGKLPISLPDLYPIGHGLTASDAEAGAKQ